MELTEVTRAVTASVISSQRARPPECFTCGLWISGVSKTASLLAVYVGVSAEYKPCVLPVDFQGGLTGRLP
jgi:hypothetical protein